MSYLRTARLPVAPAFRLLVAALLIAFLLAACGETAPETSTSSSASSAPLFVDVAAQAGLTLVHEKPDLDDKIDNIKSWMASVGSTVAAGDVDGDGWVDLYFTTSRRGQNNALYRNRGDGTFEDIAEAAGVASVNDDRGACMDAVWGDYDNDGDVDLYLVRWGRDSLYRNDGPGEDGVPTFTETTEELFRRGDGEPGMEWRNGNAVIFFDANRDGRLDIYVGNYFRDDLDLWNLDTTRIMHDDFEVARNAGSNQYFEQQEDGTFVERAVELEIDDVGWTLAVGSADLDNDTWPDLYVANDFGPDQMFFNRGDGTFVNATEASIGFDTKKGMNIDFGDFNRDGWLDGYVTNITTAEYLQEGNMLWRNNGPSGDAAVTLTDISLETSTYDGGWGWGAKFFDDRNDGNLDIFSVNGFISAGEGSYWYDLASWTVIGEDADDASLWPPIGDRSFSGYERFRLWRNDGLDNFTEVAQQTGLASTRDGRGIAVVDFDNDGDQDLAIANQGAAPHLFRNDQDGSFHWLMVELEVDPSTATNRDGVGTRVTAISESGRQIRERDGGNGYSGQSDPRVHFGLGRTATVDLLEIRWPDGGLQYLENVAADQLVTVRQDPSAYASERRIEPAEPPQEWLLAETVTEAPAPEIDPAELERQLAEAEKSLRADGVDRAAASAYRRMAATYDQHERAVGFLEGLVEARPDDLDLRLELAVAYVDSIPTCGGLAAIVCKGSFAQKGLNQVDVVVEAKPESWLGYFNRGMNHLHWPRALRHSADAASDLERCVELQAESDDERHHLRVWIALGDAYTKNGEYAKARERWNAGLEKHADAPELVERLAIQGDEELLAYVEDQRSLERTIDTDLSFWTEAL